jgi:hypothetical protein
LFFVFVVAAKKKEKKGIHPHTPTRTSETRNGDKLVC